MTSVTSNANIPKNWGRALLLRSITKHVKDQNRFAVGPEPVRGWDCGREHLCLDR